jgi:hypothetical protein
MHSLRRGIEIDGFQREMVCRGHGISFLDSTGTRTSRATGSKLKAREHAQDITAERYVLSRSVS